MAIHPHDHFTWSELLDRVAQRSPTRRAEKDPKDRWARASLTEARRLLVEGWPEGRDMIERGLLAVASPTIKTPTTYLDVAGYRPHSPLAAAGDPLCMFNHGSADTPRNTYRLAISNSVRADVDRTAFTNRGVAICRIVDALETAGHRVEIVCDSTATDGSEVNNTTRYSFSYTVKEAGQPLELDRIAFVFMHLAAHRRVNFHVREFVIKGEWSSPIGYSQDPRAENHPDAIIFPHLDQHETNLYATPAAALATLTAKMKAAGLDIETDTHA